MGNTLSASSALPGKQSKSLYEVVDYIATNYILSQNFQDMVNLSDMKYCEKIVVLTSNIIEDKFNHLEVNYLNQRLKQGVEVNEMTKDKIVYFDKDSLNDLDAKNKTNKRRMCIGISKFYVKIAHLFAAIVSTLNPTYSYENALGEKQQIGLLEKNKIPKEVNVKIDKLNLCSKRINSLLNNNNYENISYDSPIVVKPDFCDMNYSNSVDTKKLGTEPGIPELQQLYYDKFNFDKGTFGGHLQIEDNMTKEMYNEYQKDLFSFYKSFTGNKNIPMVDKIDSNGNKVKVPSITKFSQIPLRSYHRAEGCKPDGIFTKERKGTLKEQLFFNYAEHIKKMIKKTEDGQSQLLSILDELFVVRVNHDTNAKDIVINPKLTELKLQTLIEKTRTIIVTLYLSCEEDFVTGLDIFEAIVENQIRQTSIQQISELEKDLEKKIAETNIHPAVDEKIIIDESIKDPIIINEEHGQLNDESSIIEPTPFLIEPFTPQIIEIEKNIEGMENNNQEFIENINVSPETLIINEKESEAMPQTNITTEEQTLEIPKVIDDNSEIILGVNTDDSNKKEDDEKKPNAIGGTRRKKSATRKLRNRAK